MANVPPPPREGSEIPGPERREAPPAPNSGGDAFAASTTPLDPILISAYADDSGPPAVERGLLPPGFAGQIALFIYHHTYLPIPEVAIAATLGLLAGVFGRAMRTPSGMDLSLYIILVGRSGTGKEGMHTGIQRMIEIAELPAAKNMVRPTDFASGPALTKEILRNPGFLNLCGELGRKLLQMSNPKNTPMQDLRTVMTNAFSKPYLSGRSYSNAENTVEGVEYPALSVLGETTPDTFLESLSSDMLEDGMTSRFLVIEHDRPRPFPNQCRTPTMEPEEIAHWKRLIAFADPYHQLMNVPRAITVSMSADAREKLQYFDIECTTQINSTLVEAERQVWNRAHLKALKVACLLAAANSCDSPVVALQDAAWAVSLVKRDIRAFLRNLEAGDVGSDDSNRRRKVLSLIGDYMVKGATAKDAIPASMVALRIVPRRYLQQRTSGSRPFRHHRSGASDGLDAVLRELVRDGMLSEVDKLELVEKHRYHGVAYRVLSLD